MASSVPAEAFARLMLDAERCRQAFVAAGMDLPDPLCRLLCEPTLADRIVASLTRRGRGRPKLPPTRGRGRPRLPPKLCHCGKIVNARGFCWRHYKQGRRRLAGE